MANVHTTLGELFVNIANAIRAKKNSTDTIVADNFPAEIEGLRTGFDYNNQNVASVSDYGFKNCEDLKSVDCCNLTSVGTSAFEGCKNLESVILYDGVTSVGENAFKGCNEGLVIYCYFESQPEGWHDNWNPDGCEVVWLDGAVETWDISTTEEGDVVTSKLYNDIKNDGTYSLVIYGNGYISDSYQYSQNYPWNNYRSNITSLTLQGIKNISRSIFANCTSLTSVNIPNSVINIGDYAFADCTALTSITIPDSVTSIGYNVFDCCERLTHVYITDLINWCCIDFINKSNPINYAKSFYLNGKLATELSIPSGATKIGAYTFYNCKSLIFVNIPSGVTSIGDYAFSNCTSLTSITIPDSVTSIGNFAFYGCNALASITYTGTIAQWSAIIFGNYFNNGTLSYTIHCTDGDIAKDGTITYHTTT